ncbi:hypothetical protein MarSH_400 [Marseillevirus Shanghai 1]|nr:hypothetical protein MarSH_400 [Marseillevirus Shanghai 1]
MDKIINSFQILVAAPLAVEPKFSVAASPHIARKNRKVFCGPFVASFVICKRMLKAPRTIFVTTKVVLVAKFAPRRIFVSGDIFENSVEIVPASITDEPKTLTGRL